MEEGRRSTITTTTRCGARFKPPLTTTGIATGQILSLHACHPRAAFQQGISSPRKGRHSKLRQQREQLREYIMRTFPPWQPQNWSLPRSCKMNYFSRHADSCESFSSFCRRRNTTCDNGRTRKHSEFLPPDYKVGLRVYVYFGDEVKLVVRAM